MQFDSSNFSYASHLQNIIYSLKILNLRLIRDTFIII